MMIIVMLITVAVMCLVVAGICYLTYKLATSAVMYSKLAFALLIAFSYSGNKHIVSNGLLNFILWFIIVVGIIFLLSMLPKASVSIRFFCTIIMSVLAISIVTSLLSDIFPKVNFLWDTLAGEITVKIICTITAVLFSAGEYLANSSSSFSNKAMIIIERLVASLIWGMSFYLLCASWYGNYNESAVISNIICLCVTVGVFLIDSVRTRNA